MKPVEGSPTPGTCLPIEKGGTGCDASATRDYLGIKDFIVSTYRDGIYTVQKYDSGIMRFTGTTATYAMTWTNRHPDSSGWWYGAVNSIALPSGLIQAPTLSVTPNGSPNLMVGATTGLSASSFAWTLMGPQNQTVNRTLQITGSGFWKTFEPRP